LLLLALTFAAAVTPAAAQPAREQAFRAFLQNQFRQDQASLGDARYALAWFDLNGDRLPEAVVYMMSSHTCGTGGCMVYVYHGTGHSWRRVAHMTVSQTPIRVLATRTRGWLDIGIRQRELAGRSFRHYEARLRFNGRTYPLNPSMPPAERLTRRVTGRVLIMDGDPGRPLF
jgi:hypothetical protein